MLAIALQLALSIAFGVICVLMTEKTVIMQNDSGRWLLAIGVGCMASCCPMFDILFLTDKIIAILLGAAIMTHLFKLAFGPAQYSVIRGFAPMLIEARRSTYRMQAQIARSGA